MEKEMPLPVARRKSALRLTRGEKVAIVDTASNIAHLFGADRQIDISRGRVKSTKPFPHGAYPKQRKTQDGRKEGDRSAPISPQTPQPAKTISGGRGD